MNFIHAIVLGFVEGLTEFLPISSTAHLILTSRLLNLQQTSFITFFEIIIQSGAIASVILLYKNHLLSNKSRLYILLISFIPTMFIGYIFHSLVKTVFFHSQSILLISLSFVGFVFIIIEFLISKKYIKLYRNLDDISIFHAFIIGVFQATAIVPGVSRAGAIIVIMMILGYRRSESALYSFLLAIPTIISAGLYDALKTDINLLLDFSNILYLLIGSVTAFGTAFLVVGWFIKYLQNHTLVLFGVYRLLLVIAILIASVV